MNGKINWDLTGILVPLIYEGTAPKGQKTDEECGQNGS